MYQNALRQRRAAMNFRLPQSGEEIRRLISFLCAAVRNKENSVSLLETEFKSSHTLFLRS